LIPARPGGIPCCRVDNGSNGFSRLFIFKGNCYCRIRRQPHLLPFDIRDKSEIYKMMMAFVVSFSAVGLREPDLPVSNAINGSDVNSIGSNHFHMLLYAIIPHLISPYSTVEAMRFVVHYRDFNREHPAGKEYSQA
jgi:hypothetical protein